MDYDPAPLTDPSGSSALAAAISWLQGTLLGTAATAIAVLAVAAIGIMLLSGRLHSRKGIAVIVGCFLIFGARSIAASLAALGQAVPDPAERHSEPPPPLPTAAPTASAAMADPYAGAAVPMQH